MSEVHGIALDPPVPSNASPLDDGAEPMQLSTMAPAVRGTLSARIHQSLMPDYNAAAATYWWLMVGLGLLVLGQALASLSLNASAWWTFCAGVGLTMVAGFFPLKIPRTNQVFSVGDIFIVMLLLSLGPAAACIAAGLDALVSAWRSTKRWTTRLGSATIASVTMALCGSTLHGALTQWIGDYQSDTASLTARLLMASMVFGVAYAACNTLLMSTVGWLKRGKRPTALEVTSIFGWVVVASAIASTLAALLYIVERTSGLATMLAVLPTIGLMLTTLHFFTRQQEAEGATRLAEAQALQHRADLALSLSKQREAELAAQHLQQLESSELRFNRAFTHASIGMAIVALDGQIQQANEALAALLDSRSVDLIGTRFSDHIHHDDVEPCLNKLAEAGNLEQAFKPIEVQLCRRDHRDTWVSISCSKISEPHAAGGDYILHIQDVTARRHAEAELHHRAFHDKLTGLANRDRFLQTLSTAITRAPAESRMFAVLFLDFDRFKLINDSKGHKVGDEFLVQASHRLAKCLRHNDLLARMGGDEFAVLAQGLTREEDAMDLAARIQHALLEPLHLGAFDITASASIGITFSTMAYTRAEDMLRDADIAMYRAKQGGKARFALFDVKLHTEVTERVRLEGELRLALSKDQLSVAYQPIVNIQDGQLVGFEALCRWTHPELGVISPGVFIPIAEDSALITELTDYVLDTACRDLRAWQLKHPQIHDLHVHVNAASRDISDPCFVARVRHALRKHELPAKDLVIELTESIVMSQLTAAMQTLDALRELGVRLSVDDFGTGYSSLSHLSNLPIDSLKIDMSFLRKLSHPDSKEAAVIRAIVLLGTSLGKTIVAEGIETELQLHMLRDMGCHQGQGYHFSRPVPCREAERLVHAQSESLCLPLLTAPPAVENAMAMH